MVLPFFKVREYCQHYGIDYETLSEEEWLKCEEAAKNFWNIKMTKKYDDRNNR